MNEYWRGSIEVFQNVLMLVLAQDYRERQIFDSNENETSRGRINIVATEVGTILMRTRLPVNFDVHVSTFMCHVARWSEVGYVEHVRD